MLRTSPTYRALVRLAVRLVPLLRRSVKVAAGHRGRLGAAARLAVWAAAERDATRPLLWCHAPSVGEGLQAEAVLKILRARHPHWQIAYTYFSPSALPLAARQPADVREYLPYDRPADVASALDALAPTALVFTKLDLWPELAVQARHRGVRVGMIAGTVSPVSSRLRWPARALTRPGYRALESVGAIAADDAGRLAELGVDPSRITITGDPRFDSALAATRSAPNDSRLGEVGRGAPTLIAGSTWPADEAALLSAFVTVRARHPEARLVLVPHEPTTIHLTGIDLLAASFRLPPAVRFSTMSEASPLIVVDQVGLLAALYRSGTIAFVGGGFGRAGLHSVIEPAASGLPVVFGPEWRSSREAGLLLEGAGALVAQSAEALAAVWTRWLEDPVSREQAATRASAVVAAGLGAAERNARLVELLIAAGISR
ncbi:MAG: glycosyltransferase N-terminal domain-containing protein [Gemmatimonadota bacterium]